MCKVYSMYDVLSSTCVHLLVLLPYIIAKYTVLDYINFLLCIFIAPAFPIALQIIHSHNMQQLIFPQYRALQDCESRLPFSSQRRSQNPFQHSNKGGGFNKFSWGQREQGSGCSSPLVRSSGGNCNLVQEI